MDLRADHSVQLKLADVGAHRFFLLTRRPVHLLEDFPSLSASGDEPVRMMSLSQPRFEGFTIYRRCKCDFSHLCVYRFCNVCQWNRPPKLGFQRAEASCWFHRIRSKIPCERSNAAAGCSSRRCALPIKIATGQRRCGRSPIPVRDAVLRSVAARNAIPPTLPSAVGSGGSFPRRIPSAVP